MIQPNSETLAAGSVHSREGTRSDRGRSGSTANLRDFVRRAQAGDPAAQSEIVLLYSRRIAGFVRTFIRQPDAEEDVTQLVFIKMFRQLPGLRDPAAFEAWLFQIARRTALDAIRRRACRPATVAMDEEAFQVAAPEHDVATAEILDALDLALLQLSPLDRNLVRQVVAGESYATLARRFGLSLASVKVRLHRARPLLRATVGGLTGTRQPDAEGWRAPVRSQLAA